MYLNCYDDKKVIIESYSNSEKYLVVYLEIMPTMEFDIHSILDCSIYILYCSSCKKLLFRGIFW